MITTRSMSDPENIGFLLGGAAMDDIFNSILHRGIDTYKRIGSSAPLPLLLSEKKLPSTKKGAIFVTRSKECLSSTAGVKGYILTSKESLLEDYDGLSHWTPNIFNYGTYTGDNRTHVKGHSERNLQQINTFVVDIDSKRSSYTDILSASLDVSIGVPTMVLETPNGYQVYFVLSTPLFISNRNDYRGLKVAKRISENIKRSLSKDIAGVDIACNDFGFFRIPNRNNVKWFSKEMTYSFSSLIAWSQKFDDDMGRTLFTIERKVSSSITNQEWFIELLQARGVKGSEGQLGRNNLMYTIALACYSDSMDKSDTYDILDEYNSRLSSPISDRDVRRIVGSAYKGRFAGANKTYIKSLLETWGSGKDVAIKANSTGWHKHKKKREDRVRSHFEEWEEDLIKYIEEQVDTDSPIKWTTQKQICEDIGIPRSSLNEVLHKSKRVLVRRIGKGRAARTGLTTVNQLLQCALLYSQSKRSIYYEAVRIMSEGDFNELALESLNMKLDKIQLGGGNREEESYVDTS